MMKPKILVLSWLLHHANRYHKSETFYSIKDKILTKHGNVLGHDYQKIEGKKCWTCGGSGVWTGFSWYNDRKYSDICNKCGGSGWYIPNQYNVLRRIEFGKYTFHKPIERTYSKPVMGSIIIEGYINHDPSKYSYMARIVLYLLYDLKGYDKTWCFEIGGGWYYNPRFKFYPYFNNLVHILRFGKKSIPYQKLQMKYRNHKATIIQPVYDMDDLPF